MSNERQKKFDFEGDLGKRPGREPYTPPLPRTSSRWERLVVAIRHTIQKAWAIAHWIRRNLTLFRAVLTASGILLTVFGYQWAVQFGSNGFKVEATKKPAPMLAKPQPWEIMIEREKR